MPDRSDVSDFWRKLISIEAWRLLIYLFSTLRIVKLTDLDLMPYSQPFSVTRQMNISWHTCDNKLAHSDTQRRRQVLVLVAASRLGSPERLIANRHTASAYSQQIKMHSPMTNQSTRLNTIDFVPRPMKNECLCWPRWLIGLLAAPSSVASSSLGGSWCCCCCSQMLLAKPELVLLFWSANLSVSPQLVDNCWSASEILRAVVWLQAWPIVGLGATGQLSKLHLGDDLRRPPSVGGGSKLCWLGRRLVIELNLSVLARSWMAMPANDKPASLSCFSRLAFASTLVDSLHVVVAVVDLASCWLTLSSSWWCWCWLPNQR